MQVLIGFQFFSADVMVLNDIIEQAAGRHSRASERGGKLVRGRFSKVECVCACVFVNWFLLIYFGHN